MGIFVMHLDDALERQPQFLSRLRDSNAHEQNFSEIASSLRLWGKQENLDKLRIKLKYSIDALAKDEPLVTFNGSGDFHHVSQLLISCLMENRQEKITIIHFDNHPDWVHFDNGMHCGSWVNKALEIPGVEKVITLGVCSKDLKLPEFKGANLSNLKNAKIELFPYSHKPSFVFKEYGANAGYSQKGRHLNWNNIAGQSPEQIMAQIQPLISTANIYITIDKDVLSSEDVVTNWDQGQMRLPTLTTLLRQLTAEYKVIGVDVVGDYSSKNYTGGLFNVLKKKAEIAIDQPNHKFSDEEITRRNTASNMALMDVFQENLL